MTPPRHRHQEETSSSGREARPPGSSLPAGYTLDGSDPDVAILRRPDGSFSAAFSAMGMTRTGIVCAIEDDRRRYPEAYEQGNGHSRGGEGVVEEPPCSRSATSRRWHMLRSGGC